MKLEVGKYYRTRDGRKVGPIESINDVNYPFDSEEDTYTIDGKSLAWTESPGDLIAEWIDDGPVRTVTRKEIVPGVYGRVAVDKVTSSYVHMYFNGDSMLTAPILRAAAATLIEIADALDEQ